MNENERREGKRAIGLAFGLAFLAMALVDIVQGYPSDAPDRFRWLNDWLAASTDGWWVTAFYAIVGVGFLYMGIRAK